MNVRPSIAVASGDAPPTAAPVAPDAASIAPRVLVVDDDERNLLAITTVLEEVGDVVVANSGEEALRQLLRGEFAVILLDVYMPGMDGYETAQIIRDARADQAHPDRLPVGGQQGNRASDARLCDGRGRLCVQAGRSGGASLQDRGVRRPVREIEGDRAQGQQEQALLDENLRANSERLRAEQELRRAEQRQAAIIQSLPIILYLEPLNATRAARTSSAATWRR